MVFPGIDSRIEQPDDFAFRLFATADDRAFFSVTFRASQSKIFKLGFTPVFYFEFNIKILVV
jgi:hypothetical protein